MAAKKPTKKPAAKKAAGVTTTKNAPADVGAKRKVKPPASPTTCYAPSRSEIEAEFIRAGRSENETIVGGIWIAGGAGGLGVAKVDAPTSMKFRKICDLLSNALSEIHGLGEPFEEWLKDEVTARIAHAEQAMRWVVATHPGGHRETKHYRLLQALDGYFKSEELPIGSGTDSLFTRIFALVSGMDPEVAEKTIARLRRKT